MDKVDKKIWEAREFTRSGALIFAVLIAPHSRAVAGGFQEGHKRSFTKIIAQAIHPYSLRLVSLTNEWIIKIENPETGAVHWGYYYDFDLNTLAVSKICTPRATTYSVMRAAGVPCVVHELSSDKKYSPKKGTWNAIESLAEAAGYPVACKPSDEQMTRSAHIDLPDLALSFGYKHIITVNKKIDLANVKGLLQRGEGPYFCHINILPDFQSTEPHGVFPLEIAVKLREYVGERIK